MAIIGTVPGIEISILVRGTRATEYAAPEADDTEQTSPTITRYIEAIDDAEFDVHYEISNDYEWGFRGHALCLKLWVDGKRMRGMALNQPPCPYGSKFENIRWCSETKEWRRETFRFAVISTVEDVNKERVKKDLETANSFGNIEVKIYRVMIRGSKVAHPDQYTPTLQAKPGFELAEKALKGKSISHGTVTSIGNSITAPKNCKIDNLPEDNGNPIAVFQFHYRSKEALKRDLILPRTPTPPPTLSGLTQAEIERLALERLVQANAERDVKPEARIKREREEVDLTAESRPTKSVKRDMVDLTELDD